MRLSNWDENLFVREEICCNLWGSPKVDALRAWARIPNARFTLSSFSDATNKLIKFKKIRNGKNKKGKKGKRINFTM